MNNGIPVCEHCGGEVTTDVTMNQFMDTYGVRKDHIVSHGITYNSLKKYGDTPINDLPKRFKQLFRDILNKHGVKYG